VWRFPRDLDGDLRVAPKPKNRVGADRLANAIGALELAGSRARDLVVVDVGTAVTVDVVTRRCEFVGGMIAPGPRLLSRALAEFTAQLPKIPFGETRRPIGRNTKEAIEAGLWFGSRGLVAGLVRAALAARPGARVLVAGGDGARCLAKSGIPYELVPGLTHIGLAGALLRRLGEP
jgi:type III pantothenate kinase